MDDIPWVGGGNAVQWVENSLRRAAFAKAWEDFRVAMDVGIHARVDHSVHGKRNMKT
jgi:hypothetical protein